MRLSRPWSREVLLVSGALSPAFVFPASRRREGRGDFSYPRGGAPECGSCSGRPAGSLMDYSEECARICFAFGASVPRPACRSGGGPGPTRMSAHRASAARARRQQMVHRRRAFLVPREGKGAPPSQGRSNLMGIEGLVAVAKSSASRGAGRAVTFTSSLFF